MIEIWNNVVTLWESFTHSMDGFFDTVKAVILSFTTLIEEPLNIMAKYGTYIITASFLLILAYNIFIAKSDSIKHIKKVKTLVVCGLLVALNCVLSLYTLPISAYIQVGCGFITLPTVAMLFGPLTGCVVGIVQDIVSYIIKPTGAYLPMFTIIPGISSMIYGMFFYKKKVTFGRVFLAKLVVNVFVNIILSSMAMAPTASKAMAYYLPGRVVKNIVALPIEIVILYYFLKAVKTVRLEN